MSDTEEELYLSQPTGYVYDEESVKEAQEAFLAPPEILAFSGSTKRMIEQGITYWNLMKFPADLLRRPNMSGIVTSARKLIDCGNDGAVLEPYGQRTGICNGCSHAAAPFISMCYNHIMTGGPVPKEFLFVWSYLAGRALRITGKGDTGSCPPYTIRAMHDLGNLPVDCSGPYDFRTMPPHGDKSQEALCVAMRDKPDLDPAWVASAAEYKTRVFNTGRDPWMVADCTSNGRCVTKGAGYQITEPVVGGNGVSGLYWLKGGGHETLFCGWAIVGGNLKLITYESWWNALFPASKWPGHRVSLKHDSGVSLLYPGQGVVDAADYVSKCTELWGVDYPGSN